MSKYLTHQRRGMSKATSGGFFGDHTKHNAQDECLADEKEEVKNIKQAHWEDITKKTLTNAGTRLAS